MGIIMYSAESTLQDINAVDDLQHKIDCIKDYGKQCAQQTLNDAAESESINIVLKTEWLNIADLQLIKDIILQTEIKTP